MGTITSEGDGCGDGAVDIDGADGAVVDAEKEDGEAYGGDSDNMCDWTGSEAGGKDRFEAGLAGHVKSLLLPLPVVLSSFGRRVFPLAESRAGRDLTVNAVVDTGGDERVFEEFVPEADTVCDVDDGIEDIVRARVEDSLEDGEPEEGALACRDTSEEVRERLGRGALGDGSVGGGELVRDSTRLASDEVGSTTVDSEIKGFKGDVAVSGCVAVISWTEAHDVVGTCRLEPMRDMELCTVDVRESEAARARSCLDGA
jgi:hypothetical protein